MAFTDWLSSVLLILSIGSFYPQIQRLWLKQDSSAVSVYYVLFNLIAATEQFTIVFFLLVNNTEGGSVFVHTPTATGDWLNLSQMTISLVGFLILFTFTLYFPGDRLAHKCIALTIYTGFLFTGIIPELADVITGGPYVKDSDREFAAALLSGYHIFFVNPVVTIFIVVSFVIQTCRSLQHASSGMSVQGLGIQAFVFTLLGVSWLFRIRWPPSNMPSIYKSPILAMYTLVGWAPMDHLLFALGQAVLCLVEKRRFRVVQDFAGETEPLLSGH
ncbi:hypothetical protein N7475_005933 [Penicillium sp. IBT 31633x]|nr:hypothetical protein N7475_005933 [Penicillium sp. IBT 31633x]